MNRDTWETKSEFLFACIGYCVGLGNLWRFPYLVYESGGGVFLIPYFIMLFLVGIPLLYMELSIGLITQRGPIHSMKALCPIFKGIGYANVVMAFLYSSYFSTIIVYCMFYFLKSFSTVLPWSFCVNEETKNINWWATTNCTDVTMMTHPYSVPVTQDYFDNYVLHKTSGIEEFGSIRLELLGLMFLTWIMVYFFIFRGTKSIGKVVYITAIFPYIVLLALLIRGCTLPGALNGIEYFLGLNEKGNWKRIFDYQVWVNATSQIFNSIGVGFGSLITFSSFNKKNDSLLRDTICIATVNSLTSIMSGFIIFSVLGHISEMVGQDITEMAMQGPELVFVAYPQALTQMAPSPFWSCCFFFTLFILGIDSLFSAAECVTSALMDLLQDKYYKAIKKEVVAAVVCLTAFIVAMPNVYEGGIYLYKLMDWYTCVQSLAILAAFEVTVVLWIYGAKNLLQNVKQTTGHEPPIVIYYLWKTITPVLVLTIMAFSILGYQKITYGEYKYPDWAEWLGWTIASCSLVCLPLGAIHELFQHYTLSSESSSRKRNLTRLLQPQEHALYNVLTMSNKAEQTNARNSRIGI